MTVSLPPSIEQLLRTLSERGSVTVDSILQQRGKGVNSGADAKKPKLSREELVARQLEISDRCAARPVLDPRSPEEILGYNERGVSD